MAKKKLQPPPEPVVLDLDIPEEAVKFVERMTDAEARGVLLQAKVLLARQSDSPAGFAAFYEVVHGNKLPKHCHRWIEDIYESKQNDRGRLIWAFRGSWKTTTISVTFLAFRIGHEPHKTSLVISANGDSANNIASSVSSIIEFNPMWNMVFPNIVPDRDRGWGAEKYWVKRTDIPYSEWAKNQTKIVDPTFMSAGQDSSRIIGKHPSGMLLIDDIHDENNSRSDRERSAIVTKVSETILPMEVRNENENLLTWEIAVGTPWHEEDAYHYLKNTGEFDFSEVAGLLPASENNSDAVYIDGQAGSGIVHNDLVGWWKLAWPEKAGVKTILSWRNKYGKRGFARMVLLDLKAAKEGGMRFYPYPAESIDYTWRMGGGMDYASIRDQSEAKDRCQAALGYIAKIPTGGAVIVDGVVGHYTDAQLMDEVEKAQGIFRNWAGTRIEDIGNSTSWITTLLLKPHLKVLPGKDYLHINKHVRQERILSPLLELGILRVSDRDSPFLNTVRKALDDYPDGNDDVRDALVQAVLLFPELLVLPSRDEDEAHQTVRKKKVNPFANLGSAAHA